jgi:hypothetical protein
VPDPLTHVAASPAAPFQITFDGEPVAVLPGQTVAAALIAGGHPTWHETRGDGRPRGVFCGIGVCFDCLVQIDRSGPVRACLVTARPGDTVTTHRGGGHG